MKAYIIPKKKKNKLLLNQTLLTFGLDQNI